MSKKLLILVCTVILCSWCGSAFGAQELLRATEVTSSVPVMQSSLRAACTMQFSLNTSASIYANFAPGMGNYTFFKPDAQCSLNPYPFAITVFSFTLDDNKGTLAWPVTLDVVVYDVVGANGCHDGPGAELCRFQMTADAATYGYPNMGTFTFPQACCVNRPFFIGLEYVSGAAAPPASIVYDDQTPFDCVNWFLYQGTMYEWSSIWTPPIPGYPIFAVGGETNSADCASGTDCPVWKDGDPYKTENPPQLPDEAGWDVNATYPKVLADDFMCGETGFIKDIHFWGSWLNGQRGEVQSFILSFHSDISADQSSTGHSMPGELLWEREIKVFSETPITGAFIEGWYDPYTGDVLANNHQEYMQYDICLDPADWFEQTQGTVYWLNISAVVNQVPGTADYVWGWKTTRDHWNDDAVWFDPTSGWHEMYEPEDILGPINNAFGIQVNPQGQVVGGFGEDAYGEGWYQYPSEWINVWFYDHPFDPDRFKTMHVEFDASPMDPTGAPMLLEFAVNWSTDTWSIDQPPQDSMPPLPGVDEQKYIGREVLAVIDQSGHYVFDFTVPNYNPEWVSIDVRGLNFEIPGGILAHECVGQGTGQSMDLSFVITGDPQGPTGACCLPDGSCIDTDAGTCGNQGGNYKGDGTDCATADCSNNNPPVALCQDIVVPADNTCQGNGSVDAGSYDPNGDAITIVQAPPGPYPLGATAVTLTVTDVWGATDVCNAIVNVVDVTPPVVTCPADMTVTVAAGSGGTNFTFAIGGTDNCPGVTVVAVPPSGSFFPVGVTTVTVTATDAAGNTAVCTFKVTVREDPPQVDCPPWAVGDPYKTENPPQLPDEAGWNVMATSPRTLADDFMCGETGYIKDVHFWGSWLDGKPGTIKAFIISFHDDIPAALSQTGHSMPGKLLYERRIDVFNETAITGAFMEGWYDPFTGEILPNNHQEYWQYDICLDQENWFAQEQGRIYWLNISAIVEPIVGGVSPVWGWKSSKYHWNDDAVKLHASGTTCTQPDSSGTVHMPPDCPLVPLRGGTMIVTNGLPQGSTLEIKPIIREYGNLAERINADGTHASADITMELSIQGTGELAGYARNMTVPGHMELHIGPRHPPEPGTPHDPCQPFETEILSMELTAAPGDPDFDLLRIRAGSDWGLPSPGHTTLTRLGTGGNWSVDSFFDVFFEIEIEGAPGGPIEDAAGVTQGDLTLGTEGTDTPDWRELYEPLDVLGPIHNQFAIQMDPDGNLIEGFGEDAFGDGWYHYPKEQWWNVWFYDHPFAYQRYKVVHIEFDAAPLVFGTASWLEFAVNWSTNLWSEDQPAADSAPPLPGVDEAQYIGREILLATADINGHYILDYTIDAYNPEWISIDVRGFNFSIAPGFIAHECLGQGTQQSMDLSFVITGGPGGDLVGACCLPDATCAQVTSAACTELGGVYKGDGVPCAANTCCGALTGGFTGNADCDPDGKRNLADITRIIDRVYISKVPLCIEAEGNTDGDPDNKINLADITRLIDKVYISKNETAPCK